MLAKLYIALLLLFSSSSCSFQTIITFSLSLALPELRSLHLLYLFSSYSRKRNMVRKRDRFWEYAEDLKGRFKCKFCERDFAGGASRIKCHLAGVKGHDIDICTKVSKEVQEEAALIVGEPNKKLKGASTSNRDKGREINSTSISKDVTLSRVFEKSNEEYSTEIDLSVAVEGLLAKLYLVECWNLMHLPTKEAMQRLTQLKKLVISRCPKFEHNERIKISHVPWVEISNSLRWPYCKDFDDSGSW